MSQLNETPLLASALIDPYNRVNASIEPCLNHINKLIAIANDKYGRYKYRIERKYFVDMFEQMDVTGTIKPLKIKCNHDRRKTFTIQFNDRPYRFYAIDDKKHIKMSVSSIPEREVRAVIIMLLTEDRERLLLSHPGWCKQILKIKEVSFEAYTIARTLIRMIQLFAAVSTNDCAKAMLSCMISNLYHTSKTPLPIPLKEKLMAAAINESRNIVRELTNIALHLHN